MAAAAAAAVAAAAATAAAAAAAGSAGEVRAGVTHSPSTRVFRRRPQPWGRGGRAAAVCSRKII